MCTLSLKVFNYDSRNSESFFQLQYRPASGFFFFFLNLSVLKENLRKSLYMFILLSGFLRKVKWSRHGIIAVVWLMTTRGRICFIIVLLDVHSFTLTWLLNEHYTCCVMEDGPKVPYCFPYGSRHVSRVNNRKRPKYLVIYVFIMPRFDDGLK